MKLLNTMLIALAFTPLTTAAVASEKSQSDLVIENAWAKPNFGPNGAAYFTLKNQGNSKRYLKGAESPLSKRVELHQHTDEGGIMKMRKLTKDIEIDKGASVNFKPGGLHVMLFKMEKKLKPGDTLPLNLIFKDGSRQSISVKITP